MMIKGMLREDKAHWAQRLLGVGIKQVILGSGTLSAGRIGSVWVASFCRTVGQSINSVSEGFS
ncbi:MAG: hypothetical protein CM1200mP38_7000 [Dehalococcoidia bacterium]|nr:MAG: hypothetical protein CM1200mP38_7000 [Dehalococcoidia bacterium]